MISELVAEVGGDAHARIELDRQGSRSGDDCTSTRARKRSADVPGKAATEPRKADRLRPKSL